MKNLILLLITFQLQLGFYSNAQQFHEPPATNVEWTTPYEPFRIAGNLYYVGTYDLASYLITTPKGHILINTGLSSSVPMIKANIEKLGFKFEDIKILLLTHAHFDHIGGMAEIKQLTGAQLMVHERDAPVLADGGGSDFAFGDKGATFAPVKADRLLHDGDVVPLGNVHVTVLHHPGHTKGACSFLFNVQDEHRSYRVLIANMPTIIDETKLSGMATYPDVAKDYAYTINALKKQQFDIWLSSHASQFLLHKKHKPGGVYNPLAFGDHAGYNAAIADLEKKYYQRLKEK